MLPPAVSRSGAHRCKNLLMNAWASSGLPGQWRTAVAAHSNLPGQPLQDDAGLAQHPSFRASLKVPMDDLTLPPTPPRLT